MPTQRSFFSNFLLAFRQHNTTLPKTRPTPTTPTASTSTATASVTTQSQSLWTSATTSSTPQPNTKPPTSKAALAPTLQHHVTPQTHLPTAPVYGPANKPSYPTSGSSTPRRRQDRRGSDSDSDSGGFRDGGERWVVGGRTAAGEERCYRLRMVRRETSADRRSADQVSL